MPKIERDSLMSLEQYAKSRPQFRADVLRHKKSRIVPVGADITLIFEDELTVRYQVQEMLRIEKTFESAGIQDELDAYNPLVPDGSNWKATMLIEYPDADVRKRELARLRNVEHHVRAMIDGIVSPVTAIADEDMDRSNEEKTSAVHFLRFELDVDARAAVLAGAGITIAIEHPAYAARTPLGQASRDSIAGDLAPR